MKENKELKEALELLEKEKNISKETLLEAIENSLIQACKTHFGGRADNVKAMVDRESYNFSVYAEREVVEEVEDPLLQISLEADQVKRIRADRDTECKECDFAEDPRGRTEGSF